MHMPVLDDKKIQIQQQTTNTNTHSINNNKYSLNNSKSTVPIKAEIAKQPEVSMNKPVANVIASPTVIKQNSQTSNQPVVTNAAVKVSSETNSIIQKVDNIGTLNASKPNIQHGLNNQSQKQNQQINNNNKLNPSNYPKNNNFSNSQKSNPNRNNMNSKYCQNKNDSGKQGGSNSHSVHKYQHQNGGNNNYNIGDNGLSGKYDIKDQTMSEKKFTGRCRLFVGNLPLDLTEIEFKELFKKYGETGECFLNTQRSFGFIKLDTRINAEHAKQELDGQQFKGRCIRVRFASHGAAVRVKNLSPYISNEYLEQAFSMFGPVERAVVIVDDKGRPTGEGIVEFERKPASIQCINKCQENCFILTSYPRPIVVEPLEQKDEEDGLPEKSIIKNTQFYMEREAPAHFAPNNSNEHKLALKWRELYELEKHIQEEGKKRVEQAREMLEFEIEQALIDNKTMQLKEDLRMKQEELQRIEDMRKTEFQRRQDMEIRRQEDDRRRQEEMIMIRKQQDNMMHSNRGNQSQFDQSLINQSNQTGLSQGTMQQSSGNSNNRDNSNRRGGNNINQSINNGGANYDQYQIESQLQFQHNNQSLQNLPPAQQQALIAAQLSFAMAAAAQGNLNMPNGIFDNQQLSNNNTNNVSNNNNNNNKSNSKEDHRSSSSSRRQFDRRNGNNNRGGGHIGRDDSYPGFDTKRARF